MTNPTKLSITAFLLSLLILTGCTTQTTIPSENTVDKTPIKIGWIGPLTGPGAAYGVIELNAAKMAVEKINSEGGINGRNIELVVEDGKSDGAAAVTAATKLIDVDGVKYILGGHSSTETLAMLPITEPKQIFLIAGATGTDAFSGKGKYAFRTYPSAKPLFSNLADVASKKGTKTIASLWEQKDWSVSVKNNFEGRFIEIGGKVLSSDSFSTGTQDFRTQLLKIKELKPDAILLSAIGPDSAAPIINQMHELGMDMQIYGDQLVISKGTYDKTNGLLPSSALAGLPKVDPERTPATKKLLADYQTRFGELAMAPFYATESYDATMIMSELIKNCGDDTSCARTEILSKEWTGTTTNFKFGEDGDPSPYSGVVRIVEGKQVFEGD